jgi:hypothetical protein
MNYYRRFNEWLALNITKAVATMTCAYLFTFLALTGLPGAWEQMIQTKSVLPLDMWLSQNFLQLVLLSVIMVGQQIQTTAIDTLQKSHDAAHAKHDLIHRLLTDLHIIHVPADIADTAARHG